MKHQANANYRSKHWWMVWGPMLLGLIMLAWPTLSIAQKASAPAAAADQEAAAEGKSDDAANPKVKVERGAGGKKVYRITTGIVIEGRIQKPNAFYVLQRSQINYDWADLKQDFLPRINQAVRKQPF